MPDAQRRALLIDFGGVLTSDVFASFAAYCVAKGGPADAAAKAFREHPEAGRLLVERETGRLSIADFERAFAPLLREQGVDADEEGLIAGMTAALEPDPAMLDVVARLRAAGVPIAIVSNALDDDAYHGYGLAELVDVVVLSHSPDVAVRKPSRKIYTLTCERLGVEPEDCVLVDDLQQNLDGAARLGIAGILHRDAAETVPALEEMFSLRSAL